jgi:hypothetical protein
MIKYRVDLLNMTKEFPENKLADAQAFANENGATVQTITFNLINDSQDIVNSILNNKRDKVKRIMQSFRDENVLMGITSANKTAEVLGLVAMPVTVPNTSIPISLATTLEHDSLTVTIDVLNYHIAHIDDYAHLAPFITLERITSLKNQIQAVI